MSVPASTKKTEVVQGTKVASPAIATALCGKEQAESNAATPVKVSLFPYGTRKTARAAAAKNSYAPRAAAAKNPYAPRAAAAKNPYAQRPKEVTVKQEVTAENEEEETEHQLAKRRKAAESQLI